MSETVQYDKESVGLTRQDQEDIRKAEELAQDLVPIDHDALIFSRLISEHEENLPAYYSDLHRSPRLENIVNTLGISSDEFCKQHIEDPTKDNLVGIKINNLPQKTGHQNLITKYERSAKFRTEFDGSKEVVYQIDVQNRDWDGKSNLDKLYRTHNRPDSGLSVKVMSKYGKDGNLVSSQAEILLMSKNNHGASKYEINSEGQWIRLASHGEEIAARMAVEENIQGLEEQIFEEKKEKRRLDINDEQHDAFIDALLDTQEVTDEGFLYSNELSYDQILDICSKKLGINPNDLIKEQNDKEKISFKDRKYRLIVNISAIAGENTIFRGEDPRDFGSWFSYDKSSGNMTRIFEEVKDEEGEGHDSSSDERILKPWRQK